MYKTLINFMVRTQDSTNEAVRKTLNLKTILFNKKNN